MSSEHLGPETVVWQISITKHEKNLRQIPCVVTQSRPVTLHHCHGGSMKDRGWHSGTSQRGASPWLIIPLAARLHVGDLGIDYGYGVGRWEKDFGQQTDFLDKVSEILVDYFGYQKTIWELAEAYRDRNKFV